MGQTNRLRLGILFNISPNWLGGVYYIINLINALNALDEADQPEIFVFYSKNLEKFTHQIEYTHLSLIQWDFDSPLKGYLKSWLTRRNTFSNDIVKQFDLDAIYPERHQPLPVKKAYDQKVKSVSVFLDLQHKYYPEFFSKRQLFLRELRLKLILKHTNDLVVSSAVTREDFKKFYSLREDLNIHVLNFVSIIDDFDFDGIETLREKYRLPDHYFMISNQFHNHKNHRILLEALAELKQRGKSVHLAITGKMPQDDSPYLKTLYDLIDKYELDEHISFLGVIPRQEQLTLMKFSKAVIQPSLFEGWSTVIEDAKSLQVPVIASNLDVNIEQLKDQGTYFDPHNAKELADILTNYKTNGKALLYQDYQSRVKGFAQNFTQIFKTN